MIRWDCACGGVVDCPEPVASTVTAAVMRHQWSAQHRRWSESGGLDVLHFDVRVTPAAERAMVSRRLDALDERLARFTEGAA